MDLSSHFMINILYYLDSTKNNIAAFVKNNVSDVLENPVSKRNGRVVVLYRY